MNPLSLSLGAYSNRKESIDINNQLELNKNQVIAENNKIPLWAIKKWFFIHVNNVKNICDGNKWIMNKKNATERY